MFHVSKKVQLFIGMPLDYFSEIKPKSLKKMRIYGHVDNLINMKFCKDFVSLTLGKTYQHQFCRTPNIIPQNEISFSTRLS